MPVITKSAGVASTTWETFRQAWASINELKSYDRANAQAAWPGADYRITVRYIPNLRANMRIVDANGTIYSIIGKPDDVRLRRREINIMCQSGVKGI